ncbi:MAG TPA: LysE family translocator [Gemmatimonadaceae bacterium]|jgi:threonine/homoserine/homoserine lactone efflux protein
MNVDPRLLAFVGLAALLTILPGSDMALVTRNVLAYGRRRTTMTIVGIACGCIIHATASALGISAILATSATAFNVMKTVGALYLVWMGAQSIRTANVPASVATDRSRGRTSPFLQGFLTNVLNPKVAIFYLTILPQFVAPGDNVLKRSLLLASIHIAMGLVWLTAYAWFVDRLGGVLTRPRVKARLERITGGVLIALGARLAWERR